jgi:RNA polymerase sigma-70 factor (ECF subfamily)
MTMNGLAMPDLSRGEPIDRWSDDYRQHGPAILRYVRRMAKDDDTAADLLHETFARALSARAVPADEHGRRRWLFRVATNVAIDHLRRSRRFRWVPFGENESHQREPFDAEADQVRSAVRSIPPEQAVVLILRVQEGRSRSEIAEMLGISDAAVKSRLARARENFAAAYRRLERGLTR